MRKLALGLAALAGLLLLSGCGYNTMQTQDEQIKSAWSEVLNQYQRRADLIPNLVNTVKGYAAQESSVLLGVTEARAKVGSIQATPELVNDPAAFAKFQAAQGELTSALSRLLVVTENYPQLKSDQNFRDLQAQLEGTENRITVARNRYIQAVQNYNVTVRSFPGNLTAMMFGYKPKPNFAVENEAVISKPPAVDFAAPAPAPAIAGARRHAGTQRRRLHGRPRHRAHRRNNSRALGTGTLMPSTPRRFGRVGAGLALLLAAIARPCARCAVPPLTARVTDLTGTLSGEAVTRIEAKLADLEAKKGSQIAVLIVPTTQPEDIDQFGIRVEDAWKLGRKGVDDGAYLIVAKNDRRVRIEVGYGLEGALPDAIANRIITETITPHFKLGDYDGGVEAGVDQMISVVNGEPLAGNPTRSGSTTAA